MKISFFLALLVANYAFAEDVPVSIYVGPYYSRVAYIESHGTVLGLVSPTPDTRGTFSVAGLNSGLAFTSESGFGAHGDLRVGHLMQSGLYMGNYRQSWQVMMGASAHYEVIHHLLAGLGVHGNSLYRANIKNNYLGMGWQGSLMGLWKDFTVMAEYAEDGDGFMDILDSGHSRLHSYSLLTGYVF